MQSSYFNKAGFCNLCAYVCAYLHVWKLKIHPKGTTEVYKNHIPNWSFNILLENVFILITMTSYVYGKENSELLETVNTNLPPKIKTSLCNLLSAV